MDSRKMLEQHIQTLNALLRGGISRGMGSRAAEDEDDLQASLRAQWETERNLLRRVLSERGDPVERLMDWRQRTQGFIDKYPERAGWTDQEGQAWNAQSALDAIDKLLEQVEAWEMEAEEFEDEGYDD
ncbi:MAG: hypothetical protein ACRDIB_05400 [Ardenticatenaceae bacterium]